MKKRKNKKMISAREFDRKFDNNDDISEYLDFEKAIFVKRVNIDMPQWMINVLDREALKLNVSRQAIIKMWLSEKAKSLKKTG